MLKNYAFLCFIGLLLSRCSSEKPRVIELPDQQKSYRFERFDQSFFSLDAKDSSDFQAFKEQHGEFFKVYIEHILNFGSIEDPALPLYIENYSNNLNVRDLWQIVQDDFADLSHIEKTISDGLNRYKSVFEKDTIPKLYASITGFNYYNAPIAPRKIFVTSRALSVNLDLYLGPEQEWYKKVGFPLFFSKTMHEEYLQADVIRGFLYSNFFDQQTMPKELVFRMLYEARIVYLASKLLPQTKAYKIFGFTPQQYKWCVEHEAQIWTTLVNNQLLFEKSAQKIEHYFTEGPFTKDFPKESPAKAVLYVGYKIIEQYMQNQPDVSFQRLMKAQNFKQMFSQAKYNP